MKYKHPKQLKGNQKIKMMQESKQCKKDVYQRK